MSSFEEQILHRLDRIEKTLQSHSKFIYMGIGGLGLGLILIQILGG